MSFFDEPRDTKDTAQVLTDTSATEVGQNQGQVWLRAKDNTSLRRLNAYAVVGDAVVWVAGAGLLLKLFGAIQSLINIGLIAQTPAVFFLFVFFVFCLFYSYSLLTRNPRTLTYRITLFVVGILLAVL